MNTDWTGVYICKECHKTGSRSNHITTDHKEEQLEDRRNVGENSCNSGDGRIKLVQSLMHMMMMMFGFTVSFGMPVSFKRRCSRRNITRILPDCSEKKNLQLSIGFSAFMFLLLRRSSIVWKTARRLAALSVTTVQTQTAVYAKNYVYCTVAYILFSPDVFFLPNIFRRGGGFFF